MTTTPNSVATIKKATRVLIKLADDKTKQSVLKRFGVADKKVKPLQTGRTKFTHCYLKTTNDSNISYRLLLNKQSMDFVAEKIVDNQVVEKVISNPALN